MAAKVLVVWFHEEPPMPPLVKLKKDEKRQYRSRKGSGRLARWIALSARDFSARKSRCGLRLGETSRSTLRSKSENLWGSGLNRSVPRFVAAADSGSQTTPPVRATLASVTGVAVKASARDKRKFAGLEQGGVEVAAHGVGGPVHPVGTVEGDDDGFVAGRQLIDEDVDIAKNS